MRIRVGTRGSDLALWQARHVAGRLRARHGDGLEIEEVILRTNAEERPDQPLRAGIWPAGGFVAEIERALAEGRVDLAVHSYKDLTTASPPGLTIAATLERAAREDRIVCRDRLTASRVRAMLEQGGSDGGGLRVATSSPRREAQLARLLGARAVPIRGNVPTRLAAVTEGRMDVDAVVLAGAGLDRLGLAPEHCVEAPLAAMPTAPAQGALALQVRAGDDAEELVRALDDVDAHTAVRAERAFLAETQAGCHSALGAAAELDGSVIRLHVQMFGPGGFLFEERALGTDAEVLGRSLGRRAVEALGAPGADAEAWGDGDGPGSGDAPGV